MAITTPARTVGRLTNNRIFHRPMLLAAITSLVVLVWFGWNTYRLLTDQTLPPENLSAHRLRVNATQFNKVKQATEAYQKPTAASSIRTGIFAPAPKTIVSSE